MKHLLFAAAASLMLSTFQAQAQPTRAELLAGQHHGHDSHNDSHNGSHNDSHNDSRHSRGHQYSQASAHQSMRHRGADYRGHHYDNARRYAASAVRQARQAHQLGYYSDHPRWSLNFQRHFEWALKADAWKTEREARKRARRLQELRHAQYRYGYPH